MTDAQQQQAQPVIMTAATADAFIRRYVCAGCWGPLTCWYLGHDQSRVACARCGDGRGFVTKRFAERRKSDSVGEAVEVRQTLRTIGIINKRPLKQVLEDLGVQNAH